jgi:FKBP-type peptidyl-prolyl cis-trans isomerase FkpA
MLDNLLKICLLAFILLACSANEEKTPEINWTKEKSTKLNENLALEEDLRIQMYLDAKPKWEMTKTGSGLQYWIYKNGIGDQARSGLLAQVRYSIEGLEGSVFHETPAGEIESFLIDKSQIETGMQEGIKYMRIGDKAKMIVPAHLAHGLVGDFEKIPPLTTLVIDVELVGLIAN